MSVVFVLLCLCLPLLPLQAKKERKIVLLRRVHTYAATLDTVNIGSRTSYSYSRVVVNVDRRNGLLMTVPSAFAIARSKKRGFIRETYDRVDVVHYNDIVTTPLITTSTFPYGRNTVSGFARYLTPTIYGETIFGNSLISPFYPGNAQFYTYYVDVVHGGSIVTLRFKPKRNNTQLVRGSAVIDGLTGRILSCSFGGDYDHVRFFISLVMGEHGIASLYPKKGTTQLCFDFLGNKISGHCITYTGLPKTLEDSVCAGKQKDFDLMARVRPEELRKEELALYKAMFDERRKDSINAADSLHRHRENWAKRVLWDAIGDNVLNRIKTSFGMNNRGYIRINPIMNPLYMGYSQRRGFVYKFDLNFSYQFTNNSELTTRFRGGYSFKLKQFYFRVPIYYYFNKRRNGYLKLEVGNGNHISSQSVSDNMHLTPADTLGTHLVMSELNQFTQDDGRLVFNYDLNSYLSFQVGVLYQLRHAVYNRFFQLYNWPTTYRSFAPVFELQLRPWGWSGPILTADYDRGLKNVLGAKANYERYEFNGEYIHHLNKLQLLEARVGVGFYTRKGGKSLFLSYENFQEDNIPGGWNDNWTGEFELLDSYLYNTSDYYVRGNLTYESPLLLLSWLPWVGRYMEMERIYVSALQTANVHPYVELGYGFTTRLFSMGIFVDSGQRSKAVGLKFGLELFRNW